MAHLLKTAYEKERTIGPLYTSGPVALTADGNYILTCVGEDVLLTEISTGSEICRFAGDTQPVSSFCVTPNSSHLAVFSSSLSLRIYQLPDRTESLPKLVQPIRVVSRAHDAPVHVCKTDPTSTYLASGSADGVAKVWHISHGYVTHVFKGHGGVVSALTFNYQLDASSVTQSQKMQLVTASVDTRIRIFDLITANGQVNTKPSAVLEGHVSVPRGLDISQDGKWLVSGGRDSVILIWDLSSQHQEKNAKGKEKLSKPLLAKTIPALERVEAVGFLKTDDEKPGSSTKSIRIYAGGQKGIIHVWDGREGQILYTLGTEQGEDVEEQEEQREIVDILYNPSSSTLASVHADQNILLFNTTTRLLTRQLIGYNDEIVDATFVSSSSDSAPQIAFATNSSLIRIYSTSTFDARLLSGHTDIVLCLDHGPKGTHFLGSGGKDKTARIWAPLQNFDSGWDWVCVAICQGHAESIGAIALNRVSADGVRPAFAFTGSQDRTIKMWDLSAISVYLAAGEDAQKCKSLTTLKAHEKDINSLDIAPNDQLLVSGSQDRTAKVYQIVYNPASGSRAAHGEIKVLGTFKGHKRGVWSVKFDRTERIVATGSGDKTVKLWNLNDFTCIRTFEGHTNSVLRVEFFNHGTQLASSASDGLVKLWSVKDEECVETLDNHEDKIWALAISDDDKTIISGAADSVVTFWKDCTEERATKKEAERESIILKEQDFLNFVQLHDYKRAIELALAMGQPGRLFKLFKSIQTAPAEGPVSPSISGNAAVDKVICDLSGSEVVKLLGYVRDWNANAKTSGIAQTVLFAIMKLRAANDILKAFADENGFSRISSGEDAPLKAGGGTALKELLDALIPYSERHLSRMDRLVQESFIIDFILSEMDEGIFDGHDADDGMSVDA